MAFQYVVVNATIREAGQASILMTILRITY